MKKKIYSIFAVAVVAMMALSFSGCIDSPDNPDGDGDEQQTEQPGEQPGEQPEDDEFNFEGMEPDARLRLEIAQMIVTALDGPVLLPDSKIYRDITEYGLGGVILYEYKGNVESKAQLKHLCDDLQKASKYKLLISIDQEGGRVSRLKSKYGFPDFPSAKTLGQNPDAVTTYWGNICAKTLSDVGINLNFAPVVDVDVNPDSPAIGRIERSFSSDPEEVSRKAGLWIDTHTAMGVLSCVKHFPGHGSATNDSHKGTTDITKTWQEYELQPYKDLIAANKLDLVMVGHVFNANLDPEYPASLSKEIIDGLLRDKLKYDGAVITDDLGMGALVNNYGYEQILELTINAGADLLCVSVGPDAYSSDIVKNTIDIVFNKVKEGKISADRIHQAAARVVNLKKKI